MALSRFTFSILGLGMATLASGAAPVTSQTPELKAAIALAKLFDPAAAVRTSDDRAILTITAKPGRTQNVFFSGALGGPVDAKTYLIWSIGASVPNAVKPALAVRLLQENFTGLPYGAWSVAKSSTTSSQLIIYTVEVPKNAPASTIRAVVTTLALRADALDLELNGSADTQ